jgi:hypothetical protein
VQSIEINNSAPGNACCPNLFNYTGGFNSPIWTPGQTYTYQIIFKTRSGYTHPNFMYHYQFTSGESYITEYGLFDTNKMESLGDGWFHAWNTFTVGGTAVKGYTGLWYYNYNVADKVSVATIAITPGNTIRPIKQIIPSGTTRSATQGLLPLVGNSTLDLSTTSFTSNAQMTFDGTDDTLNLGIPVTTLAALSNFSMECIAKIDNYPSAASPNGYGSTTKKGVLLGATYYCGVALYWVGNSSGTACNIFSYIRGADAYRATNTYSLTPGSYHHLMLVNDRSNTTLSLYANGVLISQVEGPSQEYNAALTPDAGNIGISKAQVDGGGTDVYSYLPVNVPVTKIYNRALSAGEVRQNYLHYKTRFNLS